MRSGNTLVGRRNSSLVQSKRLDRTSLAAATACEALEGRLLLSAVRPQILLDLGSGQVAVTDFDWAIHNTGAGSSGGGGGAGAGKAVADNFTFDAPLSAASPGIFSAVSSGRRVPIVTIEEADFGGNVEARWTLTNAVFTEYGNALDVDGPVAEDHFSIAAATVKFEFFPATPTGGRSATPVTTAWDFSTNSSDGLAPLAADDPSAPAPDTGDFLKLYRNGGVSTVRLSDFDVTASDTSTIGSAGSGAGAGKVVFSDLSAGAALGGQSPALLGLVLTGLHLDKAEVVSLDHGNVVSRYEFDNVTVGSFATRADVGDAASDRYAFRFATMQNTTPLPIAAPAATGDALGSLHLGGDVIPLASFSWGASNPAAQSSGGGGAGAGKVQFDPFTFSSRTGVASPNLFDDVVSGHAFADGSFDELRNPKHATTSWLLEKLQATSLQIVGDGSGRPTDTFKVEAGAVTETFDGARKKDTAPAGSMSSARWDRVTNTGSPFGNFGLDVADDDARLVLDLGGGQVELSDFSWGTANALSAGSGGGAGTGKATEKEFSFTAPRNFASAGIFESVALGRQIPVVTLTERSKHGEIVAVWTLRNVQLTSYDASGQGGDKLGADAFTLTARDVQFDHYVDAGKKAPPAVVTSRFNFPTNSGTRAPLPLAADATKAQTKQAAGDGDFLLLNSSNGPVRAYPVDGFDFGVDVPTSSSSSGAGAGKATFRTIHLSAPMGDFSAGIQSAVDFGTGFVSGQLISRHGGVVVSRVILQQVFFTGYDVADDDGKSLPTESVTLAAGSATVQSDAPAAPTPSSRLHNQTLELDGLTGAGSVQTIAIDSSAFAAHNPTTLGSAGGGAGAGKVTFDSFQFTTPSGAISPQLFTAVATGRHLSSLVLLQYRPAAFGGAPELAARFELTDVVLSSYAVADADGSVRPEDAFNAAFAQIKITYFPPIGDPTGGHSTSAQWNVVTNSSGGTPFPGFGGQVYVAPTDTSALLGETQDPLLA